MPFIPQQSLQEDKLDYLINAQVIDETLSPTWDEMLIFNEVVMYGKMEEIKDEPPTIVIEIFD